MAVTILEPWDPKQTQSGTDSIDYVRCQDKFKYKKKPVSSLLDPYHHHRRQSFRMATISEARFAGVLEAINPHDNEERPVQDEVDDDIDAEQATLTETPTLGGDAGGTSHRFTQIQATLLEASKGVTEGTDLEYKRLMKLCTAFLIAERLIQPGEEFFTASPLSHAPWFITAWIMNSCDEIKLDGSRKPKSEYRDSYGHAQKMRAAMTYAFGRLHGLGQVAWQESPPGHWLGNPSVSSTVSSYMCSLRRRKVRGGETACSARAITPDILYKLYHFNHLPQNWVIKEYQPGRRKPAMSAEALNWGGGCARRLLTAAYNISFACLLRFDETLKIQHHDITFVSSTCIKLMLPFRKTDQYGGKDSSGVPAAAIAKDLLVDIKPFYLYRMSDENAHLCPVRALAEWFSVAEQNTGYVFRKIRSGDRVHEANEPMTTEQFLEQFRNNLLDIKIDPYAYGTHSFRRGGVQYYASDCRWQLRKICEFGGWSQEFAHMTIVKYLISWNDNPTERREDFLNPNRQPAVRCYQCGRSCHCA
ncbi:hypothetical protein BJ138DRAFT_1107580 [Hygrophoropsis aurantiaca]|uniref:Uncharacterized protein n=1 Tax=Hygrophoropsis aurantiaca TaxID=72124 RepID=A0ACB7ZRW2_9AGAM|nr:hypothetical protein BJ138DRAFT_1107580 [Hygrophoropsis aurantiaca]